MATDSLGERIGRILACIHQASRQQYDAAAPLIGESRATFDRMSAELAEANAEVARLQAELAAFEASTSWKVTHPLRWAAERLRPSTAPRPPGSAAPAKRAAAASYDAWIAAAEPAMLAGLRQAAPAGLGLIEAGPGASPAALIRAAQEAGPSHVCFHDPRDRLAPDATRFMAAAVAHDPGLDIIFADEDWIDAEGRRARPFLKPGWNPELQRGRDLLGPFTFLRTSLVAAARPVDGPAWRYDLANQVAAASRPERIRHVPAILCHRTVAPEGAALRAAAAAELHRQGAAASVDAVAGAAGWHRVVYRLAAPPPLVSVIVPTRDRADLLRVAAEMVLERTDYAAIELVLVDNGSVEPGALALLDQLAADPRVRIVRLDSAFNWSALCNAGVACASGHVVVLLNNDVALLRPDWLTVLVSHAVQPDIGAAGAKLLYPDGTLQHAGLTTDRRGIGRHMLRHTPGDVAGPFELLAAARDVWGVTGACMAVRREVFFAVGGLDEGLPITCNDVDFCLRLSSAGYRIVWTPWSVVEHQELASRPSDEKRRAEAKAERTRLQRDWGCLVQHDPFLHPALELVGDELRWRMPDGA